MNHNELTDIKDYTTNLGHLEQLFLNNNKINHLSPDQFVANKVLYLLNIVPGNERSFLLVNYFERPLWFSSFRLKLHAIGIDGRIGKETDPTNPWTVAKDCGTAGYLNDTNNTLLNWNCESCPIGASCAAETPWNGVVALFGFWRVQPGDVPHVFSECPFPGACLGAPNPKLEGRYYNESKDGLGQDIDYATKLLPEGCNEYFGFLSGSK